MARKLNKNLVVLSSAAIITVYGVGFVRTGSPSIGAGTSSPPAVAATSAAQPPATNAATAIARAVASATAAPITSVLYRDGTYTGAGSNRFGGIDVAVTIKGGGITDVAITRATTRYPAARIARLPGQVVDRQGTDVDFVTGATYSSRAFRDAVTQALAQAAVGPAAPGAGRQG